MYESILVALDGSEQAAWALPHGLAMAHLFGSVLVLLRVVPRLVDFEPGGAMSDTARFDMKTDVLQRREYDSRRAQAEGYLQGLKRALGAEGVGIEFRLAEGEPADVIIEAAKSLTRPLIVITPNGRTAATTQGGIRRVGSVADAVLHGSSTPILLVLSDHSGQANNWST